MNAKFKQTVLTVIVLTGLCSGMLFGAFDVSRKYGFSDESASYYVTESGVEISEGTARMSAVSLFPDAVAVWHFDASPLVDSTTYGHDRDSGSMSAVAGKFGNSGSFNGSGDGIMFADSNNINTMDVYTRSYSLWFKASDISGTTRYMLYKEGGGLHGISIYIDTITTSRLFFGYWNQDGTIATSGWISTPFSDTSSWHHLVCILDGTNGVQKLILDGDLKVADTQTGQVPSHGGQIVIGYLDAETQFSEGDKAGPYRFNGQIDEFIIWNRVLTDNEIAWLYNDGTGNVLIEGDPGYAPYGMIRSTQSVMVPNFRKWQSFTETKNAASTGSIKYQFSFDGGSTWHYYSGGWQSTPADPVNTAHSNSAGELTGTVMESIYPAYASEPKLLWRALFLSDTAQRPILEEIELGFQADPYPVLTYTDDEAYEKGLKVNYMLKSQEKGLFSAKIDYVDAYTKKEPQTMQVWLDFSGDGKYADDEKYDLAADGDAYGSGVTYEIKDVSVKLDQAGSIFVKGLTYRFYCSTSGIEGTGEAAAETVYIIDPRIKFGHDATSAAAPNPFDPGKEKTRVIYNLEGAADVDLYIYDLSGRVVCRKSMSGTVGANFFMWDGKNALGTAVGSGVYLYRIIMRPKDGSQVRVANQKIVLLRR